MNKLRCGPNSQFTDITSTYGSQFLRYREDAAKNNTGGIKHRNIKLKAYIDQENPGRCAVSAYETYIVSISSRSHNGVIFLPAPSSALRKGGLVFTSGL